MSPHNIKKKALKKEIFEQRERNQMHTYLISSHFTNSFITDMARGDKRARTIDNQGTFKIDASSGASRDTAPKYNTE